MTIIVGANIGRGVSATVAKRNIIKVRRAFHGQDPTVNWQEIDEDNPALNEHAAIRAVFGPDSYRHAGFDRKEPISIAKESFSLRSEKTTKIMDGVAPSKPGKASPTRFVVSALVVPKGLHEVMALVNTHFPNFEPNDPRWQHCLDGLREVIAGHHKEGRTVLWEGDTNANRPANMPKVHPKERRIHAVGNDYMGIIPGSTRVIVHGKGKVNLTIDGHDAIWANLQFKAA